jgi:hypothetical protein
MWVSAASLAALGVTVAMRGRVIAAPAGQEKARPGIHPLGLLDGSDDGGAVPREERRAPAGNEVGHQDEVVVRSVTAVAQRFEKLDSS